MTPTAEFLSKNRFKLSYILISVIVFAVGLCMYSFLTQPINDQDFAWDDAEKNNLEKQLTDDSTLVFATVIFRHGDRTPTNSYKTDPYADGTSYIEGRGALTLKGKQRMFLLGQHIRTRYSAFLPPLYIPAHLYVLSSIADRCIMSAECFLTALYPPLPHQKIHPELNWQPIPVHTVPVSMDRVVIAKNYCPKYSEAIKCVYNNTRSHQIVSKNGRLLQLLTEKSGEPVLNYAQAEVLYNIVVLQKDLGLQMPAWLTDKVLAEMRQLAITSLATFTDTPFMQKIRGGPLLDEVRQKMEKASFTQSNNELKMFVVSAHDLTLVSLLRTLGFTYVPWKPDFSATLLIELHKINRHKHLVQIWYTNKFDENSKFKMLKLTNCNYSCPLNTFLEVTQEMIPSDWQQECTTGPSDSVACPKV